MYNEVSEYFKFEGTKNDLKKKLLNFMSNQDCKKFINYIDNNKIPLTDEEYLNSKILVKSYPIKDMDNRMSDDFPYRKSSISIDNYNGQALGYRNQSRMEPNIPYGNSNLTDNYNSRVVKYYSDKPKLKEDILSNSSNASHKYWYCINFKVITFLAICIALGIALCFTSNIVVTSFLVPQIVSTLVIEIICTDKSKFVAKIDVSEGEKCLITEAKKSGNKIIRKNVLAKYNHQCVHTDFNCNHKNEDQCKLKQKQIERLLDGLTLKNVFKKVGDSYKFNF